MGLYLAAATNIVGILLFSRLYQNDYLCSLFPELFGRWGLVCIQLWGAAYAAAARNPGALPELIAVFALEKAVYVASWLVWMIHHGDQLGAIWQRDPMTGFFYSFYGVLDLAFCAYFLAVYRRLGSGDGA